MANENFSFPRSVSETYPHIIDSSPLWNSSPAKEKNGKDDEKDQHLEVKMVTHSQRKSFSHVENGRKRIGQDDDDKEDKMDLLWADFNEELSPRRGSDPPLTVAKANTVGLFTSKSKLSMVAVVKILKKLFFFRNSQGKTRKRLLR